MENYVRVKLSKGMECIVDAEDIAPISEHKWFVITDGKYPYASTNMWVSGKRHTIKLHRFLMGCTLGDGKLVDHRNGDTLDNRKINLRVTTRQGNNRNAKLRKDNKVGYKGVILRNTGQPKAYEVYYKRKGKHTFVGVFHTAREAAQAYDKAVLLEYGEFARTNESLGLL